jgi:hypothetical protein
MLRMEYQTILYVGLIVMFRSIHKRRGSNKCNKIPHGPWQVYTSWWIRMLWYIYGIMEWYEGTDGPTRVITISYGNH